MSRHTHPDNVAAPSLGTYEQAREIFSSARVGYIRGSGNAASIKLEKAAAKYLSGTGSAAGVVLTSCGQAANMTALETLIPPKVLRHENPHLVVSKRIFGTTRTGIVERLANAGAEVTWVDPRDVGNFAAAIKPNTRAILAETSSNPQGTLMDFAALHKMTRERAVPLILDHTFTAGSSFRALEFADIVTLSFTKQAGGGGNNVTGGAILERGDFPWASHYDRYPKFAETFPPVNGQAPALPRDAFSTVARKLGVWAATAVMSAHDANTARKLLPGLAERYKRHTRNAAMVADILDAHPAVAEVKLPGWQNRDENDARARQYLGGNGHVILFSLNGGLSAAQQFVDSRALYHGVALGQAFTAIAVPRITTHRQYTLDELHDRDINPEAIRMSVGVERPDVLRKAVRTALNAVKI